MPAWKGEHELTDAPEREVSLMYYTARAGLPRRSRLARALGAFHRVQPVALPHQPRHYRRGGGRRGGCMATGWKLRSTPTGPATPSICAIPRSMCSSAAMSIACCGRRAACGRSLLRRRSCSDERPHSDDAGFLLRVAARACIASMALCARSSTIQREIGVWQLHAPLGKNHQLLSAAESAPQAGRKSEYGHAHKNYRSLASRVLAIDLYYPGNSSSYRHQDLASGYGRHLPHRTATTADPAIFDSRCTSSRRAGRLQRACFAVAESARCTSPSPSGSQPVVRGMMPAGSLGAFTTVTRARRCLHARGNRKAHIARMTAGPRQRWPNIADQGAVGRAGMRRRSMSELARSAARAWLWEYRGFLFVSLAATAESPATHWARLECSSIGGRSIAALELVPGKVSYTFKGNLEACSWITLAYHLVRASLQGPVCWTACSSSKAAKPHRVTRMPFANR